MLRIFFKAFFLTICLFFASEAMAVTQAMTAHIAFATPVSATQSSGIAFGTIRAGAAGTYAATSGGTITMAGATDQTINISVDSYTADGGVALRNATCSYDGSVAGPCMIQDGAAPGTGKTLLLGVQAVADGALAEGTTAAPAFTVSVVYQ